MRSRIVVLLTVGVSALHAQWFVGIGPGFSIPEQQDYRQVNRNSFGGTLLLMNRSFCQLWYGVRLDYSPLRQRDDRPANRYAFASSTTIAAEARFFPVEPTRLPVFIAGTLGFNGTGTDPDTRLPGTEPGSPAGLGYSLGAGIALPYSSNCCGWFLTLIARYNVPNGILRSSYRPPLSCWDVGLLLNVSL